VTLAAALSVLVYSIANEEAIWMLELIAAVTGSVATVALVVVQWRRDRVLDARVDEAEKTIEALRADCARAEAAIEAVDAGDIETRLRVLDHRAGRIEERLAGL